MFCLCYVLFMADNNITIPNLNSFESLKQINDYDAEYWSARELQIVLGYAQWRRFESIIIKAMDSCDKSGNKRGHHFAITGKPIEGGKGAIQNVKDYHLSRFACYLIAQNGDPKKYAIANAQKYFAIQARNQELSEQAAADTERLELRNQAKEEFKQLSGAARQAGVENKMFGVFHDAGYKGMYGGKNHKAIKSYKGIPEKENLMDRMDATELAANQFRMTQTREKLSRDKIRNQQKAISAHESVGKEVRGAIRKIGGTLPENIQPGEHVKNVEKRLKSSTPKMDLEERDASGLLGESPEE